MDTTIGQLATAVGGIRDEAAKGRWVDLVQAEFAVEAAMTLAALDADKRGTLRDAKAASDAARRAYGDTMRRGDVESRAGTRAKVALFKTYYPFIADATLRTLLDRLIAHYAADAD